MQFESTKPLSLPMKSLSQIVGSNHRFSTSIGQLLNQNKTACCDLCMFRLMIILPQCLQSIKPTGGGHGYCLVLGPLFWENATILPRLYPKHKTSNSIFLKAFKTRKKKHLVPVFFRIPVSNNLWFSLCQTLRRTNSFVQRRCKELIILYKVIWLVAIIMY
jgi:hypothetical protein